MDPILLGLFIMGIVGLFAFLIFLFSKVMRDSLQRKGKWGMNFELVYCPRCGMKVPPVRIPTSFHQALWGGWTCKRCGCEMDKWGVEKDREE